MRRPSHAAITRALAALARDSGSFDAARYFRAATHLRFYNVGMPRVRALAREIHAANPEWTVDDAMALAETLMVDPHLETKAVGIEFVARYRRSFRPAHLEAWKRWLAGDLASNWASTDAICGYLIGPLLVAHPELIAKVCRWRTHRNLWVRRASAVALLLAIRRGLALDEGYEVARDLHADPHDLMHKAVGWLLRELGKRDIDRLAAYLREHGPSIPRTTVRYAIEKCPPAMRAELLASTRG